MSVHPAALSVEALAEACETRFTRRSGPGGQNRNKVETAVIVRHVPTGLSAEASERRSQTENLKVALFRLRINLALTFRQPAEAPSTLWQSRCRNGKISINAAHDDFPSLLAEALDHLSTRSHDPKAAAEALGCTPSQLLRFLKDEPRAFHQVNQVRARNGFRPLL